MTSGSKCIKDIRVSSFAFIVLGFRNVTRLRQLAAIFDNAMSLASDVTSASMNNRFIFVIKTYVKHSNDDKHLIARNCCSEKERPRNHTTVKLVSQSLPQH